MGRAKTPTSARSSQRQLRVGEQLRHVLAELLSRGGTREPLLAEARLTVSEVRVSRDLRQAVVFVTELGGTLRPEVKSALEHAAPQLGGAAARQMHLKYAPHLSFRADESFAQAARIDALLQAARRGPADGDTDG